jgi:hypothetical protein
MVKQDLSPTSTPFLKDAEGDGSHGFTAFLMQPI